MKIEYRKDSDVYAIHNLYYGSHGNEKQNCPDGTSVPTTILQQLGTTEKKHHGMCHAAPGYDKTCLDLYLPGESLRQTVSQGQNGDIASRERRDLLLARYLQKTEYFCCTTCASWDVAHKDGCMESSRKGGNSLTPKDHLPHTWDGSEDGSTTCDGVGSRRNQASKSSSPALAVFVHGGGWRRGDRKAWRHYVSSDDTNLLVALLLWAAGLYGNVGVDLASRGIACAVISYPLASPSLPVFLLELIFSYLSGLAFVAAVLATSCTAFLAFAIPLETVLFTAAGLNQQKNGWCNPRTTSMDHALDSDAMDPQNIMHSSSGLDSVLPVLARTFGRQRRRLETIPLLNSSALDASSSLATLSSWGNVALAVLCIYHLVLLVVIGVFRSQYRLHRSHVLVMAMVAMTTITWSSILAHLDVMDARGMLQICCFSTLVLVHLPHLFWRLATPRDKKTGQVGAVADAVGWLQHWGQQRALYDPTRTLLIGHSAGGHLVSLLGLDTPLLTSSGCPPRHIKAVISVSGVYDLRLLARTGFLRHFYLHPAFGRDVTHWDATSPLQRARCLATDDYQWTPAFLLVRTASEGVAATGDSHALYRLLRHAGCRVRHLMVPGCNHFNVIVGLGGRKVDKGRTLLEVFVDFVEEHVTSD